MSVCLVTGGAGFIGSHVVDALVARGDVVRVLDNFQTGALDNLTLARHRLKIYFGDLANLDLLRHIMHGVNYVFHYAAPPVWEHAESETGAAPDRCVTNTMHLLLAAREANVRRIIYASTCEVYGLARGALSESSPVQPASPVGIAKLAEEQSCLAFTHHYGLETVGLRYFNVFGPRLPAASPYAAAIPQILKPMLLGRSPVIAGDGLAPHDFLYVGDAVHANLLASEAPRVAGKVFNIARGLATTALDLVQLVNGILATHCEPIRAAAGPRAELHNLADITRAEVELGFCAGTDLEEGLRHCITDYTPWRDQLLGLTPPAASSEGSGFPAKK